MKSLGDSLEFQQMSKSAESTTSMQNPQDSAPLDVTAVLRILPNRIKYDVMRTVRDMRTETHIDKCKMELFSRAEEEEIERGGKFGGMGS